MKKLWKMFLAVAVMSIAICLFVGTEVFAETKGGELCEGFSWSFDTESKTLTLKGEGDLPKGALSYLSFPWEEHVDDIQHIYLDGITSPGSVKVMYNSNIIKTFSGRYGKDITWELDLTDLSFVVDGTGNAEYAPWSDLWFGNRLKYAVIGDEITKITWITFQSSRYSIDTVMIGKSLASWVFASNIVISPDNPYYSSYEGSVYTKGFEKLVYCPATEQTPKLHPDVKIIGKRAFRDDYRGTIIIPWGVTTIEEEAFVFWGGKPHVVLPDTITSMQQTDSEYKDAEVVFIYSRSNEVVHSAVGDKQDSFQHPIAQPVDSLAEYYPDIPEAQGQSSSPVSEPSQPPVSQPESSTPSGSGTSSQTPTTSSSQPSTSSGTSSQLISEPSSSQPEESSVPEESSAVLEEPSSEVSVSEPESSSSEESALSEPSAPAEQSGGFSNLWPLFFALGTVVICAGVVIFLIWRKRR